MLTFVFCAPVVSSLRGRRLTGHVLQTRYPDRVPVARRSRAGVTSPQATSRRGIDRCRVPGRVAAASASRSSFSCLCACTGTGSRTRSGSDRALPRRRQRGRRSTRRGRRSTVLAGGRRTLALVDVGSAEGSGCRPHAARLRGPRRRSSRSRCARTTRTSSRGRRRASPGSSRATRRSPSCSTRSRRRRGARCSSRRPSTAALLRRVASVAGERTAPNGDARSRAASARSCA